MVFEKKQLSKVLAIALMVACAVAFMPLLSGQVFAASKVTGVKAKVSGTTATVTWKKVNKAKQYTVKVTGAQAKTVKAKKPKAVLKDLAAGDYKVKVKASKGAKTKWSKAVKFTVKAQADRVEITGIPAVAGKLTATVYDKDGNPITEGVTYQWYRTGANTGGDNPIAGATEAEYTCVATDEGYPLYVLATVDGKEVKSKETAEIGENYEYYVVGRNINSNDEMVYHTIPVVGDIALVGYSVDGEPRGYVNIDGGPSFGSYQWYADGVAINGATSSAFRVTKFEVGKVLSIEMTDVNIADGSKTVTTATAAGAVVESKLPTEGKVTGMTVPATYDEDGDLKTVGIPAVGDTLSVEFTAPEGAEDPDATYQWTRGGATISGATAATYTVKQADLGKALAVVVKNADGYTVTMERMGNVCANMTEAVVTVADKTPTMEEANSVASVKLGTTTIPADDYDVVWYVDSVDDANVIYNASGDAVAALEPNTQYYKVKDAAAKTPEYEAMSLVGHTLIATAEGTGTNYVGTAQSAATPAVTAAITGVTIASDTGANTTSATTLTATAATGAATAISGKPDVTYQWSKQVEAGGDFVDIAGATAATYEPSDADALEGVLAYKVTVAGTASYKVTEANSTATYTCAWDDPAAAKAVTFTVENANEEHAAATPAVGDELTIAASIAKAEKTMTYTWTLKDTAATPATVETKTGASYTIPATAKKGYTVTVAATNSDASYTLTQYATPITVQGLISKVELVSDGTVLKNYLPTGKAEDDHVAAPQVGDTLAANVTAEAAADSTTGITKGATGYSFAATVGSDAVDSYQWYADGKAISGETGSTYEIADTDLGKKITVEVEGADGYLGAAATSAETGAVVAYGNIVLIDAYEETPIDQNGQLETETSYIAFVEDANEEIIGGDLKYTVTDTTDGRVIASETGDDIEFELSEREIGHTISVTVSGTGLVEAEAGSLTWSTDLVVVE